MELMTYWRYYYRRDLTLTLECLILFLACLTIDIFIWRAHYIMSRDDPGFLNDKESIVHVSQLDGKELEAHIDAIITKVTGLKRDTDMHRWPSITLRRCRHCNLVKTDLVHHCSMCRKCVFIMDHHCCFSNRCVGYLTMDQFVRFTFLVGLLTVLGTSTIIGNMLTRNVEFEEGLTGLRDFILMIIIQ